MKDWLLDKWEYDRHEVYLSVVILGVLGLVFGIWWHQAHDGKRCVKEEQRGMYCQHYGGGFTQCHPNYVCVEWVDAPEELQ